MAKPDIEHTLRALNVLVLQMLDDARTEQWEALLERQPIWLALVGALTEIDWPAYSETDRQRLGALLQTVQANVSELTERAEAWQPELQAMLSGLTNASKLDRAYRG
ncbi:flagellar protein FliT [Chitinibacteraceae bacterium HSL-7]